MLKEVLMVKVLITCNKSLNIVGETVIYQLQECVLSNVLIVSPKKDYTEEFLTFIRSEQRRSNVMTSARVGSFCRKYNINIGCFDGTKKNPRNINQRDTALKIHNNHFCSIWKSYRISFNQVKENELKPNIKVVDNVISDKQVRSFIKNEYNPKKVKSPLTNIVVYDLETFNKIRAVPYCSCIYKLSKISGKYHRDIS